MTSFDFPTGTVTPYTGAVLPDDQWVDCDGTSYDGTQLRYASLWALLGTTYGGTGITSFKVPNLGGRVPVGVKAVTTGTGLDGAVGAWTGSVGVTLSGAQSGTRAHTHAITDPGHTHATTEATHQHTINLTASTTYLGTHSEIVGYGDTYHSVITYHPAVYDSKGTLVSNEYYSDDSYWTYGDNPIYGTVNNTPTGTVTHPVSGTTDATTSASATFAVASAGLSGFSISTNAAVAASAPHGNTMPTIFLKYLIKL
jgi:microcystin-dependent protein